MLLSLTFYYSSSFSFSIFILYLLPSSSTSTSKALSSKTPSLQTTTTTSTRSFRQPTSSPSLFIIEEAQNTIFLLHLKTPRHHSNGLLPILIGTDSTTYSTVTPISRKKYSSPETASEQTSPTIWIFRYESRMVHSDSSVANNIIL
ncbi:hypothetical protein K1719_028889 [Acacia pycnantha]|nr:hypothetical protein K1719_028889 [Acacia pycnantha]